MRLTMSRLAFASLMLIGVACTSSVGTGGVGGGSFASSTTGTCLRGCDFGCPPSSSYACCIGDGKCCACVARECESAGGNFSTPTAKIFTTCVCASDVCGQPCADTCLNTGTETTECYDCVETTAKQMCAAEFESCSVAMTSSGNSSSQIAGSSASTTASSSSGM
jgi:hypothetical protein